MDLVVLPSGKGKPILNLPQIPASLARKVTKLWSSHHEPLCTAQVWTTKDAGAWVALRQVGEVRQTRPNPKAPWKERRAHLKERFSSSVP